MRSLSRRLRAPEGFSLVELLATMGLVAVLMTLGAFAVRQFWLVRSLAGAQDEVVTQLRTLQESSVAESHPIVYGAFFYSGDVDHAPWGEARFEPDPDGAGTETASCEVTLGSFDAGVYFTDVDTTASLPGLDSTEFDEMVTLCGNEAVAAIAAESGTTPAAPEGFLFYLARGVANSGDLTLTQPNLGRTESVRIVGLTGRVIKT